MAEDAFDRDEWMRRTGPLYPVLVAIWMLTRVPMPRSFEPSSEDLGRAAPWFPLVGALMGAALAVIAAILLETALVPALVAAVVIGLLVAGTGGLGELAATRTADRVRDDEDAYAPSGSLTIYGLLALAAVVGLRGLAFLGIDTGTWAAALIVSQAIAHWVPLLLLQLGDTLDTPLPRRGSVLAGRIGWTVFAIASGATALLALVLGGAAGFLAMLLAGAAAFGVGLLLQRRFGGLTGDGLATAAAACELIVLLCFAAAAPAATSPWVS
jgi:adenosylcobinamide-GDP ribazoletransferase